MRAELSARHANYNTHMLKSAAYELMKWLSRIDGISYRPRTFITGCRNIQTRVLQDAKLFAKSTGVWVKRTKKQITQRPVNVSTKEIWFLLEKSGNKTNLTRDFLLLFLFRLELHIFWMPLEAAVRSETRSDFAVKMLCAPAYVL